MKGAIEIDNGLDEVNCFAKSIHNWREEDMTTGFPLIPIRIVTHYLVHFGSNLEVRHHTAMLRYLTFTALDIPHICCDFYDSNRSSKRSREDAADFEDEHAYELALLEELLREFQGDLATVLQDPREEIARLILFWERTWLMRMQEVKRSLEGSDLGIDERRRAEELGVVWDVRDGCKPSEESDNPHRSNTLEHWMFELERIEAECE
ncbi:hypothetical protein IMZ48_00625 [Candidatus Bathyarchaeota archaeon]|nr:hypothetical protein [Candidatus Bathyarchaeota archaeon]